MLNFRTFAAIVLCAATLGVAIGESSRAEAPEAASAGRILMGTARAADGTVLEGVAVSARQVNGTRTISVYTDAQGDYYFPQLAEGRYGVWAQAVAFEAARSEVTLSSTREPRRDFVLKPTEDFIKQLTSPEYYAALPVDTREDRRLKQLFLDQCTGCHQGGFVLQFRFDEAGWRAIIERMEVNGAYGNVDNGPNTVLQHYKGELAAYLARMRGPDPSPMKFKPFPRPTGDAARVVVTEYSVPPPDEELGELVDADGSDWSEGYPSSINQRGVHDVAIDLDGNAWITSGEPNRYRSYAKVDAVTGKVTNFKVAGSNGFARRTHGIKTDQKGIIWIEVRDSGPNDRHVLGRLDPKTEAFEMFDPSSVASAMLGNTI